MKVIKRDWNWWAYFWRVIHRQNLKGINKWDRGVTKFIIKILGLKPGTKLLDLACGSGEHTRLLTKKGIRCVGIDIAPSLISYAKKKVQQEKVKVKYLVGDIRKIDYSKEFDYCIMIGSILGFFDMKDNIKLLVRIKKALKPGGLLLFDIKNPKKTQKYGKNWMQINKGYFLINNKFDSENRKESGEYLFIDASGNVNIMTKDLRREFNRLYFLSEIKYFLHKAGFEYLKSYGGFNLPPIKFRESLQSPNIVILAQKIR